MVRVNAQHNLSDRDIFKNLMKIHVIITVFVWIFCIKITGQAQTWSEILTFEQPVDELKILKTCNAQVLGIDGNAVAPNETTTEVLRIGMKYPVLRIERNFAIVPSTIQKEEQQVISSNSFSALNKQEKIVQVTKKKNIELAVPIEATNLLASAQIKSEYLAGGKKVGVLKETIDVPLMVDGRQAGSIQAKVGTKFPLLSETDNDLILLVNDAPFNLSRGKADVVLEPSDPNDPKNKNIGQMIETWKTFQPSKMPNKHEVNKSETPPTSEEKSIANSPPPASKPKESPKSKLTDEENTELNTLLKSYGKYWQVVIRRKLSAQDFQAFTKNGMEAYEVLVTGLSPTQYRRRDIKSGEPTETAPINMAIAMGQGDPELAILVTTQTSFQSKGRAEVLAILRSSPVKVTMEDGFAQEIQVLIEIPPDPAKENRIQDIVEKTR